MPAISPLFLARLSRPASMGMYLHPLFPAAARFLVLNTTSAASRPSGHQAIGGALQARRQKRLPIRRQQIGRLLHHSHHDALEFLGLMWLGSALAISGPMREAADAARWFQWMGCAHETGSWILAM